MKRVVLEHGDGGLKTRELLEELFLPELDNPFLRELGDSALLPVIGSGDGLTGGARGASAPVRGRLALTTDSHVVSPAEFPGGDIGKLAVAGTVNDLAVAGATPLYLTVGFILEEGLPLEFLQRMVRSMASAAKGAGVRVVAGDTKVVPRGQADGIFINTAGVGLVPEDLHLGPGRVQPGDRILINGTIGDHGVAILATRAGLEFETPVRSDCAALNGLIASLLDDPEVRTDIRFMRDPTRGGVVTVLKELALAANLDVHLREAALPITPAVRGACDLLGVDPLYLANEGKVVLAVSPRAAERALELLRKHELGHNATELGEVARGTGRVLLTTKLGGTRRLEQLTGAPLPRIC